jgi:hypothetical protein
MRKVTVQGCDRNTGRWEDVTSEYVVVVVNVDIVFVNVDDDSYGRLWYTHSLTYTHTHTINFGVTVTQEFKSHASAKN